MVIPPVEYSFKDQSLDIYNLTNQALDRIIQSQLLVLRLIFLYKTSSGAVSITNESSDEVSFLTTVTGDASGKSGLKLISDE
jgi:hypothetical protein